MTNTELAECPTDRFRDDVIAGLSRPQKRLAAKYF